MAIHTEIEISRSPEQVRKILLDFPSYPTWTQGFIKSIVPLSASPSTTAAGPTTDTTTSDTTTPLPGTKLRTTLQGMTISPTVIVNTPLEFRWRGMLWGIPGLFTGEHSFRFEPASGGTSTKFVHAERFEGVLAFLIRDGTGFWRSTREGFLGFNGDLKRRCEELS